MLVLNLYLKELIEILIKLFSVVTSENRDFFFLSICEKHLNILGILDFNA